MAKLTQAEYDAIPWQEVESSNIKRVAWKRTGRAGALIAGEDEPAAIGDVLIEFGSSEGRAYRYANVAETLYEDLVKSASVGSFFANNIRGRFEHERVEVDTDGEE